MSVFKVLQDTNFLLQQTNMVTSLDRSSWVTGVIIRE